MNYIEVIFVGFLLSMVGLFYIANYHAAYTANYHAALEYCESIARTDFGVDTIDWNWYCVKHIEECKFGSCKVVKTEIIEQVPWEAIRWNGGIVLWEPEGEEQRREKNVFR